MSFIHCPRCGNRQNSDEVNFCTKCGLQISDVKELLAPELRQTKEKGKSELIKARRQGAMIIFSSFALIIVFAGLREFFPLPKFIALIFLLFMIGGAFRASMPSFFSGKVSANDDDDDVSERDLETSKLSSEQFPAKTLPEAEFRPPVDFGAKVYDTNELVPRSSVTEGTTRNLKKEFQDEKPMDFSQG